MRLSPALLSRAFCVASAALLASVAALAQGPGYTANDRVEKYRGRFLPGMNTDYVPPWSNKQLADLAAGNPAKGVRGVGALTLRPGLQDKVLGVYGYDVSEDDFAYYESLGLTELTAIVGFPADDHRAYDESPCYREGKYNALFEGLYEDIWDYGANGTPYDDRNEFAKYMYEIVTRYKDQVRFWEIWNEPGLFTGDDSQVFWGEPDYPGSWWTNDPDPCDYSLHAPIEHYVRTLRIAYEIVKAVAPDDYVVLAGAGSPAFLDAVLRNTDEPGSGRATGEYPHGGGAYFDVFGYHAYPHHDGSVRNGLGTFSERHSDGAADGIVDHRLAGFREVLEKYGYDGRTYPRKEHIVTEIGVPRRRFGSRYMGSDELQVNFMPKALINLKLNDVYQMHVFSIGDKEPAYKGDNEFDFMGMYEYLPDDRPFTQEVHPAGISYKTASDLIAPSDYDASLSRALGAGDDVRAHAFRRDDGETLFVLWAETTTDLSESASAEFRFPSGVAAGTLTEYEWDYGYSGKTRGVSAAETLRLTGRPRYFTTAGGSAPAPPANDAPTVTLSTDAREIGDVAFAVDVRFSEDVTGLSTSDFAVRNASVTGLSGSGARYTATVDPAGAGEVRVELPGGRATDDAGAGNVASNRLTVDVVAAPTPSPTTAPTGEIDLSLDLSASSDAVGRYDYITYTLTLRNAGGATATGVAVDFPKPDDYAYADSDAGAGAYRDWEGTWDVGTVGAGQAVTLDVRLYALTDAPRVAYAEVSAAAQRDADSTPGNGDGATAREDDEVLVNTNPAGRGGGDGERDDDDDDAPDGGDLSLDIAVDDARVDRYAYATFTLTLRNSGDAEARDVAVSFPKPDDYAYVDADADAGKYYDWTGEWSVGTVRPGQAIELEVELYALTDDRRVAFAEVASARGGDPDSAPGNGNGAKAREDDEALVVVNGSASPSGGDAEPTADGVDLELAIASPRRSFSLHEDLPLEVTVRNAGREAARDVVVAVPYPDDFVHSASEATRGDFDAYTEEWDLGDLPAGASATLELDVFALRGYGAAVAFAEVAEQGGARDVDSSPGNAAGTTPREDDEASLLIGASTGSRASALVVDDVRPAGHGDVQVVTFTTRGGAAADAVLVDVLGRPTLRLRLAGEGDGTHRAEIATGALPAGTYYLSVATELGAAAFPVQVR